ncbi:hypothetical protein BV25DRAFT_1920998 [Artomyces pyxidatus]|uniref:Uncharacterized protein n=1 Tax=Artomyces pyxidatus TaxID=48021 RepID=A0ACB8SKN9_9AGAM|nr:hypothetical protein BV25DRAFT_1920998 [Artomyces pyxidatus]
MSLLMLLRPTGRMRGSCSVKFFSSPSSEGRKTQRRSSPIILRTLDPERLEHQDFFDLSLRRWRSFMVQNMSSGTNSLPAYSKRLMTFHPRDGFPDGTHGFFYYNPPTPPDTVLGEVRFRVTTSNDPASFASGSDLKLPDGQPWNVPPSFITPRFQLGEALMQLLLAEKLVNQTQLDIWDRLPRQNSPFLTQLEQPFPVDFSSHAWTCWLVSEHGVMKWKVYNKTFTRPTAEVGPHTNFEPTVLGKALVRWEMSKLEIHAGKPVLVLRLVKALTDLTVVPKWAHRVTVPLEGELIHRKRNRVWKHDFSLHKNRSTRGLLEIFLPNHDWPGEKKSGDNDK